jgi:23S rRNA (uracil1939-C5)-methyltransferase
VSLSVESFEIKLDEMVHGGKALGRHQGRPIFIPYTIPGERIIARIVDDHKKYAFAEGVTLLEPSPERVDPVCVHFGPGRCGGCHFQHIDYQAQLGFKRDVVIDQFKRIGGFSDAVVHPTIASPSEWQYRSHVTFHVDADGNLCFVGTDDQTLIPIEECHIIRPELLDLLDELDLDIPELERVRLQVGNDTDDRLVILSTKDDEPPEITVDIPVSVNFLFSDNEPMNLIGNSHARYVIHGRAFRVTAGGFFQVNVPQAEKLVELVLERLNLQGGETVLDLYAGVGLFTAFIAERADLVISVESYPPAVTDADENLSEFDNIDLIEGSVEDVLPDIEDDHIDAVVLDPPRSGIEPEALDTLVEFTPQTIVYVSCDPATLARDAKRLVAKGYRLIDVQPVDMFPQTFHIECVAHFERT